MSTEKIEQNGKSNANGKRKTQWCPLSMQSHKNTVSSSGIYANVSANVMALNRCSVMKIRWNKNDYYYYYYYYY